MSSSFSLCLYPSLEHSDNRLLRSLLAYVYTDCHEVNHLGKHKIFMFRIVMLTAYRQVILLQSRLLCKDT